MSLSPIVLAEVLAIPAASCFLSLEGSDTMVALLTKTPAVILAVVGGKLIAESLTDGDLKRPIGHKVNEQVALSVTVRSVAAAAGIHARVVLKVVESRRYKELAEAAFVDLNSSPEAVVAFENNGPVVVPAAAAVVQGKKKKQLCSGGYKVVLQWAMGATSSLVGCYMEDMPGGAGLHWWTMAAAEGDERIVAVGEDVAVLSARELQL